MATELEHFRITYNQVHNIIKRSAEQINQFKPDLMIAIGGGGFFPARVLRTFLKGSNTRKNVPIHAIGLSLYEPLPGTTAEQIGNEVIRTQWLGPDAGGILLGKRILIVDEVDDSRKTLQYALSELQKDVEKALESLPRHKRESAKTKFAIFVVHNKLKPKLGSLPEDILYYAGDERADELRRALPRLDYPWEATDIEEHDRLVAKQKKA